MRKTYHSHHLSKNWKYSLQIVILRLFFFEIENGKSIPLTPSTSELKGLFQFCLIYRYIFHKMVSEKLITLITCLKTGRSLYRQQVYDYFCCWKWKWKNHATHATKLKNWKNYSNSAGYIEIFFTKWIEKNLSLLSLT